MLRVSKKRWLEGGWDNYQAAVSFYRRIWRAALERGLQPGEPIPEGGDWEKSLVWLVQGHPNYVVMTEEGIGHFTIQPDGRGNHRFVLVDHQGVEHPFSTSAALTGFTEPLRQPPLEDDPMGEITS